MATIIKLKDGSNTLTFSIHKMSATQAESWMLRAAAALGKNLDLETGGNEREIVRALCAIPFDDSKALLDELLACCYKVDGKAETQVDLADCDGYITSPLTLLQLRVAAAKANFGFFTELKGLFSRGGGSSRPTAEKSAE